MLSNIVTWVGAVLGIAVLFVMAFGPVALDFTDVRGWRRSRSRRAEQRPAEGVPARGGVPAPPN
ncbi:hypothetical protein [Saccharomonospora saliphila]|uniref:hypothetical protein n=1 Tax=Saccharomonospora saliphila TaxID=369829 RepID=UPI000369D24B|nr:hypothetical protein [Saccharomonospora saliphila]